MRSRSRQQAGVSHRDRQTDGYGSPCVRATDKGIGDSAVIPNVRLGFPTDDQMKGCRGGSSDRCDMARRRGWGPRESFVPP